MWTSARRKDLAKQAAEYDAVIVLGCDGAVETIRSCLQSQDCQVIPGMEVEGLMNVIPTLQFPFNILLEVGSVTRVLQAYAVASPSEAKSAPKVPPQRRDYT